MDCKTTKCHVNDDTNRNQQLEVGPVHAHVCHSLVSYFRYNVTPLYLSCQSHVYYEMLVPSNDFLNQQYFLWLVFVCFWHTRVEIIDNQWMIFNCGYVKIRFSLKQKKCARVPYVANNCRIVPLWPYIDRQSYSSPDCSAFSRQWYSCCDGGYIGSIGRPSLLYTCH